MWAPDLSPPNRPLIQMNKLTPFPSLPCLEQVLQVFGIWLGFGQCITLCRSAATATAAGRIFLNSGQRAANDA